MTRIDELKAGQGLSVERVRALLDGRTPGEWKVYKYWNGRLDVHSPTGEDDTCTSVITYPTAVDVELLALAPALGEALISSEARVEALTLERDRLAHELRLLREAVGVPAWTTIPLDLARAVLTVGRAQWGVTVAQAAEAHGAMMAQSVRLTAEHFQQGDEAQAMQVVFLEGTEVVIAYTGTSPYSGTTAQGMTAAWNRLHEDCAEAVAHASLSDDTPERSGTCAVCQGLRLVLVDDDCEVPCPHCTEAAQ